MPLNGKGCSCHDYFVRGEAHQQSIVHQAMTPTAQKSSIECPCLNVQTLEQLADYLSLQQPANARHGDDHLAIESKNGQSLGRGQRELTRSVEPSRIELSFVEQLTRAS